MEYAIHTTSSGTYRFPIRLYENHIKGIDLVIKSLKKRYPFVTGKWSLWRSSLPESNDRPIIDIAMPILIEIDLNKVFMIYDFKAKFYLKEVSNLGVIPDDKETTEKLRQVDDNLKKYVETTYQLLPESLRIEGGVKFDWFKEDADFEVAYSRPYVMNYVIKPTDTMSSQQ